MLSIVRLACAVALAACPVLLPAPSVRAQGIPTMPFGLGGENVESETSMTPFKVKLRGFLKATPKEKSLGVYTLGLRGHRELYPFEVMTAEAVDYPRISSTAILQPNRKRTIDFHLAGPKELLSKIGQAEPGTPLAIIGFLRQRNRDFQLISVETLGTAN
jgi:hypothetical protein